MAEETEEPKDGKREENFDPTLKWDPKRTPPALTYAWAWFSYHATQRLTAFHYFLIIVGILATGYTTALEKDLYLMQVVIGCLGAIVSLAFMALDVRNTILVDDGRAALWNIEGALHMEKGIYRMDENSNHEYREKKVPLSEILVSRTLSKKEDKNETRTTKPNLFISHSFWLRGIEFITLLLFVCAATIGICNLVSAWSTRGPEKEYRVRVLE